MRIGERGSLGALAKADRYRRRPGRILAAGCWVLALFLPAVGMAFSPKPVEELDLMSESELRLEAIEACTQAVLQHRFGNPGGTLAAVDYLKRISLVARKHSGEKVERWYSGMILAAYGYEMSECATAFDKPKE